jgi:hypothetical protein
MERPGAEVLVYHPNAVASGDNAQVDAATTAGLRVNLRGFDRELRVEWFRALDGVAQPGAPVRGGGVVELKAPWSGQDVVVRLY